MAKWSPILSDKICPVCGDRVIYKRKRDVIRDQTHCSIECRNKSTQKYFKIVTNKICPICNIKFRHHKKIYCSRKCSGIFKTNEMNKNKVKVINKKNCKNCLNEFIITYRGQIYCSNKCFSDVNIKKYNIDELYFKDLNKEKAFILGKIWYMGIIINSLEFRLYGNIDDLSSISNCLSSTYKIKKSMSEYRDKFNTIKVFNDVFVSTLIDLGMCDVVYREWPWIDKDLYKSFFDGYISVSNKVVIGDKLWIRMISKSMAYESSNIFNLDIIYKDGDWWNIK